MRQSRFTVEEVIRIIAQSELPTASIAATARKYGVKEATLYRSRAKYKGLGASEAKRLQVLEDENRRLKKLLADKQLIIPTLNEILKKLLSPAQKRGLILELRRQGLSLRLALDLVQLARASFYRQSRGRPQEDEWR